LGARRLMFAPCLLALLAAAAAAYEERATETPYSTGERLVYSVRWDPPWFLFFLPTMEAGEVNLQLDGETEYNNQKAIRILFQARSSGTLAKMVGLKVEDEFVFFADPRTLCTLGVSKKIREGKRKRQIDIDYLRATHQLHIREIDESVVPSQLKKDAILNDIPSCIQDPLSALYFLRRSPLRLEHIQTFVIGNDDKIKPVESRVVKQEVIETPAGKFPAWRITTAALMGGLFKEGGQFRIWLSADERRLPLQFEVTVHLGRALGKLKFIQGTSRQAEPKPSVAGAGYKPNSVSPHSGEGNHSSGPWIAPGI